MFTIAFCDDNKAYSEQIWDNIADVYDWANDARVMFFSDGSELIEFLKEKSFVSIDLLVLDVEMPGTDGIEVKDLAVDDNRIRSIVFVTSHQESMGLAFGNKVWDFFEKSKDEKRLVDAVGRIKVNLEKHTHIELDEINFNLEDLLYTETINKDTCFYLFDQEYNIIEVRKRVSLKSIMAVVPDDIVVHVGKNHLVNLMHALLIRDKKEFVLKCNKKMHIPISQKYYSSVCNKYMDYQRLESIKKSVMV